MNIIDVLIILIIGLGAVVGFKRGFFKETVMTVGFVLVFIISYLFKNPVAEILSLKLKSKYVAASVVILIVFAILYYFYLDLEGMINFVTSLPFAIVSAVVQVVYPVMVLIAGCVLKNKKIKPSNFVTGGQIKIQYTNISKVKKLKNNFSFNKNKVANVYDKVFEKV